ncbi:MAG: hypothetical protein ICV73_03295 [Acetobacteraceae bacterium]|nr:hypothetical protein [Acetobacteraceae bacterium]
MDGVSLRHTDRGAGQPIVFLIHGNAAAGGDYGTGRVVECRLGTRRGIASDRPGFGPGERPRGCIWTAMRQAGFLHQALQRLRIERLAARHPADTPGVVPPLSGYRSWTLRPDVLPVTAGAIPILGGIPALHGVAMAGPAPHAAAEALHVLAGPGDGAARARVLRRHGAAAAFAVRATPADGALMIRGALRLRHRYDDRRMPVLIRAGRGEKAVRKRGAEHLQAAIPGSVPRIVEGPGAQVPPLRAATGCGEHLADRPDERQGACPRRSAPRTGPAAKPVPSRS